jgi:hypothetical protein
MPIPAIPHESTRSFKPKNCYQASRSHVEARACLRAGHRTCSATRLGLLSGMSVRAQLKCPKIVQHEASDERVLSDDAAKVCPERKGESCPRVDSLHICKEQFCSSLVMFSKDRVPRSQRFLHDNCVLTDSSSAKLMCSSMIVLRLHEVPVSNHGHNKYLPGFSDAVLS